MILGAENATPPGDYGVVTVVVLLSGAALAWWTQWNQRKNAAAQRQSENGAINQAAHHTQVEEFDVVGDLAMSLTDKVLARVEETQRQERDACDAKIDELRHDFNEVATELRAEIADCHAERAEFTEILKTHGLLPG